jgi:hypothetical protein
MLEKLHVMNVALKRKLSVSELSLSLRTIQRMGKRTKERD